MGRIQSSVGLITGVPIQDTVDKLMALAARPRDLVIARNAQLEAEQLAVSQLTSLVLGLKLSVQQLAKEDVFAEKAVTSSDASLLSAALSEGGQPAVGTYPFTPVRQAQTQQLLSSLFAGQDDPIGEGTLSIRHGGFVDRGIELAELDGGAGVHRGNIRITDRSGASAEIDLRFARTVDDVLDAINQNGGINVTAVAAGDAFRLIDETGQTLSNLRVQEVNGGTTAEDLGLEAINVAADEATGRDIVRLYDNAALGWLNDGNGVALHEALADLEVTFRDGSSPLQIDFFYADALAVQASATTDAVNGDTARIIFTAREAGAAVNDVQVVFQDTAAAGDETYIYDADTKTLTIGIESGVSQAMQVVAALSHEGNEEAASLFSAEVYDTGWGSVTDADTGTFAGGADAVPASSETTLGDLIETINQADPTRLTAEISGDGDRIVLTDLTTDTGGTFSVTSLLGGSVAEDLGLTGSAAGGVIAGERLHAGLKTSLLRSLNGGDGLGEMGLLDLTDRSGASDTVDLANAKTLDDVIELINAASVDVTAHLNDARNGIQLTDTTGASATNLIVASGDATDTAGKLGITVNAPTTSVNSGSLDLQIVSPSTSLDSLNGGDGVSLGSFVITDSAGEQGSVKLNNAGVKITTIGGVMDAINALTIGVTARINDTGDGILLIDTAAGEGTMSVREVGSKTTAADLNLLGEAVEVDVGGSPTQVIDGSTTLTVDLTADDSLEDLVASINALDAGVVASSMSDGSGYRLLLISQGAGAASALQVDTTDVPFSLEEAVKAQDALLLFGSPESAGAGALVASSSNAFQSMIGGVDLTIQGASTEAVTVQVEATDNTLVGTVTQFVVSFNSLRDTLDGLTAFNEVDNTVGVLFASTEALRVETNLARLLTDRFFGVGDIESLETLGLSMTPDGRLELDAARLQSAFAADPDAVKQFFTSEDLGVSAKLDAAIEALAGSDRSLLVTRAATLADQIKDNQDRIGFLNERLDAQRERLLAEFYNMELVIGKMQASLDAIAKIQPMPLIAFGQSEN